jgi:hypothetical protein
MGWKSHQAGSPFGEQVLDGFHVGQGLSELGYVETQRLKQADFQATVELLFHRPGERFFLNVYGLLYARHGFTPEKLGEAYLARRWARPLAVGLPLGILLVGLLMGGFVGRSQGMVFLLVGMVSWLLAVFFSSHRFVREASTEPSVGRLGGPATAHKL